MKTTRGQRASALLQPQLLSTLRLDPSHWRWRRWAIRMGSNNTDQARAQLCRTAHVCEPFLCGTQSALVTLCARSRVLPGRMRIHVQGTSTCGKC
eukprot:3975804-Pleurochrysis_carterae.AAC.1